MQSVLCVGSVVEWRVAIHHTPAWVAAAGGSYAECFTEILHAEMLHARTPIVLHQMYDINAHNSHGNNATASKEQVAKFTLTYTHRITDPTAG